MACPVCSGGERREIAPGFFECRSVIRSVETVMVPDPGMPGWHRPVDSCRQPSGVVLQRGRQRLVFRRRQVPRGEARHG